MFGNLMLRYEIAANIGVMMSCDIHVFLTVLTFLISYGY